MHETTFVNQELGKDWAEKEREEAGQQLPRTTDCRPGAGYRELLIALASLKVCDTWQGDFILG